MRFLITVLSFLSLPVFAQNKAIVYLKDKPDQAQFSLSKAAADRRARLGVTFDKSDLPINSEYSKVIVESGGTIIHTSKWLNAVLVESKHPTNWANLPFVSHMQVVENKKSARSTMSESLSIRTLATSDKNFNMHHGQVLGNMGYKGRGMHIAVFDAGFLGVDSVNGFKKLQGEKRVFYTRDLVNGSSVYQYDEHGTQTLSVMAGYIENVFTGTAVDATFSLFVTEASSSETLVEEFNWVVAAEIADSLGVDVISSSLGYTQFDGANGDHTFSDLDGRTAVATKGAVMAARKGILVVNSAGNYRAQGWQKIGVPADADSIITVGAVSVDSLVANFSSPGPTADGRLKPEVTSLGVRTAVINRNGQYGESNGTSFSTPLIAGLCASLWQSSPDLSNQDIRKIVIGVSHKFANPDTNFGYGIPDFAKALEITKGYKVENGLLVFPNPAPGKLFLGTGNISGSVNFIMMNSLGQVVSSTQLVVEKNTKVDLSILLSAQPATGTYFLNIIHSGGTEEKAVVITN